MSNLKQDALKILKKDVLKNEAIINLIENDYAKEINIHGEAVSVKQDRYKGWRYITSSNEKDLKHLVNDVIHLDTCFAALDKNMIPVIARNRKIIYEEKCYKMVLLPNVKVEKPKHFIEILTEEEAFTVNDNWPYANGERTLEFIRKRIRIGISGGFFLKDSLISWCITQDDGAMAFLHTIDEFRKYGYAESVSRFVISEIRKQLKTPFLYIVKNNEKSLSLAKKLGFTLHSEVSWVEFGE